MSSPDKLLYEYAVIRCVPRVEREEFVNIGLIMMNKRQKWMKSLVILDEERLKALYHDLDINCLRTQSKLFEMQDVPVRNLPVEEKYRWLTAVKSACLQVSPSHPGLLPRDNISLESEFDRLFSQLVL